MSTEQFCLRWNDFHTNITSAFSDIRDDDDFLDVTLVCDGDIVRAHKLVLSACSPLFRIMLKKNSHPQPMIFLRGIRFPDMVAILNFMYHGEVNVNQEDLQNFLAAAEELRIKGLSQASSSTDSKLEKLDNTVPKMKQSSGDRGGQPPAKKARESSPSGASPSSTPSAKSPVGDDEEADPPQLSVKREFSMNPGKQRSNTTDNDLNDDEEDSQQNNLLDCLVQAQNYALQQAAGNKNFDTNNISNFSSQHMMQGSATGQMSSSQNDKGLVQFFGQNNANSAAANAIMMQRLLGTGYELHPLGSRKDNDPLAHIKVARSSKGWHCPQCIHISSTKGNLKSHILSGRHKSYTEKPFGCQYCDRSYGTKQSLQVHISTNHRAERDAEYQALSKSLGMKSFPETSSYSSNYESSLNSLVNSPSLIQQMSQLQSSVSGAKFPELSITKYESHGKPSSDDNLQIIPRTNATSSLVESGVFYDAGVKSNMDIQEQINMLRNMPDIMKMNTNNTEEEVEELSEEDGSPLHQEDDRQLHVTGHVNHVDTSIATP